MKHEGGTMEEHEGGTMEEHEGGPSLHIKGSSTAPYSATRY